MVDLKRKHRLTPVQRLVLNALADGPAKLSTGHKTTGVVNDLVLGRVICTNVSTLCSLTQAGYIEVAVPASTSTRAIYRLAETGERWLDRRPS
jgi:predicted ATPase